MPKILLFNCKFLLYFIGISTPMTGVGQISYEDSFVCEKILKTLFEVNSFSNAPIPKIEIKAADIKKPMGAYYHMTEQLIVLEKEAIEVCKSFGPKAHSAIAFLIGHELTHHYQRVLKKDFIHISGFLAYSKNYPEKISKEKTADIQGAFTAWLGTYDITLIPELIDRLYDRYQLSELEAYPSKADRKKTAREALEQVEKLINTFETSNLLNVLGYYDMAKDGYEFILEWYQGREIYNNLGVLYSNLAMNVSAKNVDPYILPLELDFESRLTRGSVTPLTEHERRIRQKYLTKASNNFDIVQQQDSNYFPGYLNKMCNFILEEKYNNALAYSHIVKAKANSLKQLENTELAIAISYALLAERKEQFYAKAYNLFDKLNNSSNTKIKAIASFNLSLLKKELSNKFMREQDFECSFDIPGSDVTPFQFSTSGTNVHKGHTSFSWDTPSQNEEVLIGRSFQADVFFLKNPLLLSKDFKPETISNEVISKLELQNYHYQLIPIFNCHFLHLPCCQLILQFDHLQRLKNCVKYIE